MIPIEHDLWGAVEIADYLKMSESHIRQRILPLPGFPQAIRLAYNGRSSHPRWKAIEVIQWVESHQEARVA
jgi:predicted DNA-binding transcriptional regulator AlpA